MNAALRSDPAPPDMRGELRQDIAEHLSWLVMHASHAVDYAQGGNDVLLANSLRHSAIYLRVALASLNDLLQKPGGASARAP